MQYPGRHPAMDDEPALVPEEFIAEENLNYDKNMAVNEGVESDDETVKTSNLPPPSDDDLPSQAIRRGPLTLEGLEACSKLSMGQIISQNCGTRN